MIKKILTASLCFSLFTVQSQVYPVTTILDNGSQDKRINLVFLGDGYTSAQQSTYIANVTSIKNSLFAQSPFLEYQNFFNVYAIQVPSVEEGAKHAGTATDVSEPASPVTNPNNYFGSRFDVSNIHRLLVPNNYSLIQSALASNTPFYDQVFILVNSTVYGGSGGTYATSSINSAAGEIAIHEIGHSFANLGDEYWFNCTEKKNRTSNNNPATIVWKNWLNTNNVSIYTIGGSSPTCYRPHQNCKMQVLNSPFCSVCKEAFIDKIYSLVSPIERTTPVSNSVSFVGPTMDFSLVLISPNPNTLKINWKLNGTSIAMDVDNVNLTSANLISGNNTLVAEVTDGTTLSKAYLPATSGYLNSFTWTISNTTVPLELLDFEASMVEGKALLSWETASERNTDYFTVQKSTDGRSFRNIGTVKAAGNSSTLLKYDFIDSEPLHQMTFYRLEQVDKDGRTELSPVKTLQRIDQVRYEIYPNPVVDVLGVQISTRYEVDIELTLFDLKGQLLSTINRPDQEYLVENIDMSMYAAGNYLLKIKAGDAHFEKVIVKN